MQAFEKENLLRQRAQTENAWYEFLRVSSLSSGIYHLPAGGVDGQQPHSEDEVYYVLNGRGTIRVEGEDRPVEAGSLIFVAARAPHHFHSITEDLDLLVFFAPPEGSQAGKRPLELHYEVTQDEYLISTDDARLDIDMICDFLSTEAYWSKGRPRHLIELSIQQALCFGVHHGAQQVGFARVITDYATMAYLSDIFILPAYQGRGLGKWLVATILQHPELRTMRKWTLDTEDAHALYAQFGFTHPENPKRHMEYRPHDA